MDYINPNYDDDSYGDENSDDKTANDQDQIQDQCADFVDGAMEEWAEIMYNEIGISDY